MNQQQIHIKKKAIVNGRMQRTTSAMSIMGRQKKPMRKQELTEKRLKN